MAHKKDYEQLEDKDIVRLLEDNITRSIGYYDSQLSKERKRCMEYYNGVLPKPSHDGNSRYVSQDVYDSVSAMSAALLETFAAGTNIVKFAPQNADDLELAQVASSYCDYVLFRQNDGFKTFSTVIHDGLMARAGIAKVYYDKRIEVIEEEFERVTPDELDMLIAQEGVELIDQEEDELGLISGTIGIDQDKSQVVIESIPPEEFVIEPQAKSLEDINFCAHRSRKTLSELREMGFEEDLLSDIGEHEDVEMESDPEILARHEEIGSDRGFSARSYQDQVRSVLVYEAYIMLDVEGSGLAKLHKVMKAGNVILDVEEVDRMPFCAFVPLPIPHAFYGSNFADKVIATQNARTVLTRSILDHAVIANNPRYMVVKGGLTNARELSDNRVGGLVNVSRPDAVAPLPQAPLNPFVFQTIKMLDEDKEDTTGVSRLSQGTNKDAVSKQNSAAMIEQLATMSQQRQKIIARNFANQFIKPLVKEIYRLVIENEDQEKIVELAGKFVPVNPSTWTEQRDVVVELALGYGEQDREAQKMLAMHTLFSQDQSLMPMYTAENRFALMKAILEKQGVVNVEDYITPPDKLPQQGPDPAMQLQMAMAQKQMEIQERQTALAEQKAAMEAQMQQMKIELEAMKAQSSHTLQADNMDLKEAQFAHKKRIDEGELEILRRTEDVRGIASPTG